MNTSRLIPGIAEPIAALILFFGSILNCASLQAEESKLPKEQKINPSQIQLEKNAFFKADRQLPPDLPLMAAPPQGVEWTHEACVLQPWGPTQYAVMHNVGDLPENLAKNFGFNTLVILPLEAHNAISKPNEMLTEEEFHTALAAYRKTGYRIILYSSIIHCGHAPIWQRGTLANEHPEWSQRDSQGGTVALFGAYPWLCPNTGALDYTMDYTAELVKRYQPDGILLDNNEFLKTKLGHTCYCEDCQKKFAEYIRARFQSQTSSLFGDDLRIPTAKGPLYNLWIHWRNRVWAEATERFRSRMREAKPGIILLANTQFLHTDWDLASDLQFPHEDVILSESRQLNSRSMSLKTFLGQALAQGRPLWNYIGTFQEKNYNYLRPPAELRSMTAVSMARLANPWMVYYGFDKYDEKNEPSRAVLKEIFSFRSHHPNFFQNLTAWTPVASLVSSLSRNCNGTPLISQHVRLFQKMGIPSQGLYDQNITPESLSPFQVIIAENVSCLGNKAAEMIANWVRSGGTLIVTPDFSCYDEIGGSRPESLFTHPMQKGPLQSGPMGRGQLIVAQGNPGIVKAAQEATRRWQFKAPENIEAIPYVSNSREVIIHLINHGPALSKPWKLTLPESIRGTGAKFLTPMVEGTQSVPMKSNVLEMPPLDSFGILALF